MDELELINRCIQKDHLAWDEFVKKYSTLIVGAAQNRLKKYGFYLERHEIDDIKQNTLFSIWEDNKLEAVKNPKDISYWLAMVAGNKAIDYVRKYSKEGLLKSKSLFEKIGDAEFIEIIPSEGMLASEEAARSEISKKVSEAIESLPAPERLIIKLHILDEKKYYEIADMLRLPRGTVSTHMRRGKEKLRKILASLK